MNLKLTLIGAGIVVSVASVAFAASDPAPDEQSVSDVQSACVEANARFPNACPCIADAGRAQGLSDEEIIAAMTRDRKNDRLSPADRARFNHARFDCVIGAARADYERRRANDTGSEDAPYTAWPTRPQPRPADDYIGQAPVKKDETPE